MTKLVSINEKIRIIARDILSECDLREDHLLKIKEDVDPTWVLEKELHSALELILSSRHKLEIIDNLRF